MAEFALHHALEALRKLTHRESGRVAAGRFVGYQPARRIKKGIGH